MKKNKVDDLTFEDIDHIIEEEKLTEIDRHPSVQERIPYEIIEDYGVLKEGKRAPYYLRKIDWNSHIKYDVRTWGDNGTVPYKGVTLNEEEILIIYDMAKVFLSESDPIECIKDCSSGRIKCLIMRHLATLNEYQYRGAAWSKECNLVDWGYGIKFDIRSWKKEYERCGKGISLDKDEITQLTELLEENRIV